MHTTMTRRPLLVTLTQLAAIVGVAAAETARADLLDEGAIEAFTPPAIGDYWPDQGGIYAGQVREDDGTTYHVILADAKPTQTRLTHATATKWAKSIEADGHADFELPSRRASALLYANLSDRFERTWHWTSTSYFESYAWICSFTNGYQTNDHKGHYHAARAVRRFKG